MNMRNKDKLIYAAMAAVAVVLIAVLALVAVRVSKKHSENAVSTETQVESTETTVVPDDEPTEESVTAPEESAKPRPTVPPTEKPVARPTAAPTAKPTATPTAAPTATPTAKPSSSGGGSSSSSKATPTPTVAPTQAPEDDGVVTYEEYNNMTVDEQKAHFESFEDMAAFFEWYNNAKAEHEVKNPAIEIGGDGTIDLNEIMQNQNNGQ